MKLMHGSFYNSWALLLSAFFLSPLLLLTGCGQQDPLQQDNPIVEDFAIAYLKRPVAALDTTRGPRSVPNFPEELDNNDPEAGITPGNVFLRDLSSPSSPETNLTEAITAVNLNDVNGNGAKSAGDVSDLAVSYDGTKLVFSLHEGMYTNLMDDEQPTWNIYEFDLTQPVSASNPHKLMDDLEAEKGNDIDPHYLPDGRIVFSSDRQSSLTGLQAVTGLPTSPGLDEERRDPVFMLHVMDANGENVKQITFNQSHEFNPTVLQDGRILFSRWERTGGRNQFSLYTVNPDGSGLDVLYGTHTFDGVNSPRAFVSAEQMQDGQLLSILTGYDRPRTTLPNDVDNQVDHYNDGELVIIDQANFIEMDQKRFTSTSQSTVGQVSATDNRVPVDGSLSQYGRYYSAFPIWEDGGGGRALVSWSLCRLTDATEVVSLPCVDENIRDPDYKEAEPRYGIYMYDLNSKLKKPIVTVADGMAAVDPVAVIDRPFIERPVILPDPEPDPVLVTREVGTVHIKSVYDTQSDVPMVDTPLEPLGRTALTTTERDAIPLISVTLDPLTGEVVNDPMRTDLVPRTVADIAAMSDPMQLAFNQRVARFVRITKAVPTIDDDNITGDDFGRSGGYEMREILGYAPVEPDGSVYMEVPADVPFTIQVLDAQGRAFQSHTAWLQVKSGEQRVCNGCHSPRDGQQSINLGAQSSIFPNTDGVLAQLGETMAEARYNRSRNSNGTYGQLTMDMVDNDIWPAVDELTEISYVGADGLTTTKPLSDSNCETDWNWATTKCRIVVNYDEHIQPIWDATRMRDLGGGLMDYRCTSCHNDDDPNVVPAGHLALDATADINVNHVTVQAIRENRTNADRPASYEMLFVTRPRMEVDPNGGTRFIVVRDPMTDQPIDVDGNIIAETDFGNLQFIDQRPGVVRGGAARARSSLLVDMITGDVPPGTVDHSQLLTAGEKRLIIEWIDNAGQVYNDPVAAAVQ